MKPGDLARNAPAWLADAKGVAYFVLSDTGQRFGPADLAMMLRWIGEGRVQPTTMVEDEESGLRVKASSLSALKAAFFPKPVAVAVPSWSQPPGVSATPVFVPSNMGKAIGALVCSFLVCNLTIPFGVLAVLAAGKVDGLARLGEAGAAEEQSERAAKFANIVFGSCAVFVSLLVIYFVFMMSMGAGSGSS